MNFIRFAIDNPVKIAAGVILISIFGLLAFFSIPVQLIPNVDEPVITITTQWIGASPQEIEREIVDRQEEKLKSITGLKRMTSTSRRDGAEIRLEFNVGMDKDAALRDTIEKINQVSSYPDEVDRPAVTAADAASSGEIAWIIFRDNNGRDVSTLFDYVDDEILPRIERVEGVGSTDAYGGREREVQVRVDPAKMAALGITFRELETALRGENINISAGTTDVGKRQYTYRTVGRYTQVSDVMDTVIAYKNGGPIYVRDLATVVQTHKKAYGFVKSHDDYCLAIPVRRETGANVMSTMEGLRATIDDLNKNLLNPRGMSLTQVYDETVYIDSAIHLVVNNIFLGGLLATVVLLFFLRSASATLIVVVSIPISVVGTFLVVTMLGRSLNVIMLAGMAFAVGMVVDNAVVVLENIYRHRQLGASRMDAALKGAGEVWGAILASTLTTAAVFIPVIFIKEEAGQLFRDIAIAIASAVILSLIVAVTVIPPLAARLLGQGMKSTDDHGGSRFGRAVASLVAWINRRTSTRIAVVAGLTAISLIGSKMLIPPSSYLPSGNRNFVFGFLVPPPGYAIDEFHRMGEIMAEHMRPFWEAELDSPEAAALPEVSMALGTGEDTKTVMVKAPPVSNFFYAVFQGAAIMGCFSKDEARVNPLIPVLTQAGNQFPGCHAVFFQVPLFGRGFGSGNSVELDLRCDNEESLNRAAGALFAKLLPAYGYPQPDPQSFNVGRPEIQAVVDRVKAADLHLSVSDIGFIVGAAINGSYLGSYIDSGDEVDLVVKVNDTDYAPRDVIAQLPLRTPTGQIVPLSSVVSLKQSFEPQSIRHSESARSIKFTINLPEGTALESGIADLEENFIEPMRASGVMSKDVIVTLQGNADKLAQTQRALIGNFKGLFNNPRIFGLSPTITATALLIAVLVIAGLLTVIGTARWAVIVATIGLSAIVLMVVGLNTDLAIELLQSRAILALVVTYLLMAALFESFIYPLVIMLSVPLALVGGFAGLWITHWATLRNPVSPIQQLDVLTMLGFIILVGIVVNNAILIVHQALNNMRERDMDYNDAIATSVRTRVRPIFMTALTSIGGMLPLVIMPGSGSELYRGLGSVMVGGLFVSTVFTLILVPAMFSLFVQFRLWVRSHLNMHEVTVSGSGDVGDAYPTGHEDREARLGAPVS